MPLLVCGLSSVFGIGFIGFIDEARARCVTCVFSTDNPGLSIAARFEHPEAPWSIFLVALVLELAGAGGASAMRRTRRSPGRLRA